MIIPAPINAAHQLFFLLISHLDKSVHHVKALLPIGWSLKLDWVNSGVWEWTHTHTHTRAALPYCRWGEDSLTALSDLNFRSQRPGGTAPELHFQNKSRM